MVTNMVGWYTEPRNLGSGWYATTYWTPSDSQGKGRSTIMYLAEQVSPVGVGWAYPGIVDWSHGPPPARLSIESRRL
jgi:hypothetical protein